MKKYAGRSTTILLILVLAACASFALKLLQIQNQSIWFDEGWSAYSAAQSDLITAANVDATNPPLYYMLMYAVGQTFGTSEFSLRVFSAFLGVLVIPLAYRLAKRAHSSRAGLIAAVLVGVSPLLWWASQEARMYTLMAVQVMIAALAWDVLRRRHSRTAWIALWLSELAILYTHNSAPVIVVWLNAITVLVWVSGLARHAPTGQGARFRQPDWRMWIAGQVVVVALWMPYFFTRFVLLGDANSAITSAPTLSLDFAAKAWAAYWVVPWERITANDVLTPSVVVVAVMGGTFVLSVLARGGRWLVLHSVLLTIGVIAALIVLGNELHGRYLVMIAPLLVTAIAVGVAAIPVRVVRGVAVTLVIGACVIPISAALDPMNTYRHDDARSMVLFYADHLTADDTVLAWSYADRYELAYYWDRLGVTARRVTLPEGADYEQIAPMLPTSGDVALNVWYTQRADYRGMLGCLLGDGVIRNLSSIQSFSANGMFTQIYRSPSLSAPEMQAADIRFSDENGVIARVTQIGAMPDTGRTNQAQCIPIEIMLERATDVEFKAALIVLNSLGWEIARTDAIIATANQRTTANAAVGERLMAFPLLKMERGTPPLDYTLVLRLYDERDQPNGYTPNPEDADRRGLDAVIGTWAAGRWDDSPVWDAHALDELPDQLLFATVTNRIGQRQEYARNGDTVRITLEWRGNGDLPALRVRNLDDTWSFDVPPQTATVGCCGATLDWREIHIPIDAPAGELIVAVVQPDGTLQDIGAIQVQAVPMVTDAPPVDVDMGVVFAQVGELVGANGELAFRLDSPPQIDLVWRAGTTPDVSYTAFVQMLNAEGQVIAQSDSIPAGGNRPTTGWREGEYIVDGHTLTYNDLARAGTVTLIAGLYDAVTGQRVTVEGGADHVVLGQGEIE